MTKIVRVGTVRTHGRRAACIYVRIEYGPDTLNLGKPGPVLSITGTIGPLSSGNALGSSGQIGMCFAHRDLTQNDPRTYHPVTPDEIAFAPGWNADQWYTLLDIWARWHLNGMRAECQHQRALGWKYNDHHDPKTYQGEACPVCGYKIGSAWLYEPVPQGAVDFLSALPETDRKPAWV